MKQKLLTKNNKFINFKVIYSVQKLSNRIEIFLTNAFM